MGTVILPNRRAPGHLGAHGRRCWRAVVLVTGDDGLAAADLAGALADECARLREHLLTHPGDRTARAALREATGQLADLLLRLRGTR